MAATKRELSKLRIDVKVGDLLLVTFKKGKRKLVALQAIFAVAKTERGPRIGLELLSDLKRQAPKRSYKVTLDKLQAELVSPAEVRTITPYKTKG